MTPEELRRRACDLFDEGGGGNAADCPGDPDDLAAWSMIAQFLETREVVLVPAEFRYAVLRTVRRAKLSRDALLLSVVGFGTGLVLSFVVALALGLDWWPRALVAVQPGTALAFLQALLNESGAAVTLLTTLIERGKPFWSLLPSALLVAALFAALAQLVVFRILRAGVFAAGLRNYPRNPHLL
jgi:hypothetical protein